MIRKQVSQRIFYMSDTEMEEAMIDWVIKRGFKPENGERPFVSAGKSSATVTFQVSKELS